MKHKWTDKEFKAFKRWEKRFDRPLWWMLGFVICLPIVGLVVSQLVR